MANRPQRKMVGVMPAPKTVDEDFTMTSEDLVDAITHLTDALHESNPLDTVEVSVFDIGVLLMGFHSLDSLVEVQKVQMDLLELLR